MANGKEKDNEIGKYLKETARVATKIGILGIGFYLLTGPYSLAVKAMAGAGTVYTINNLAQN